MEWLPPTQLGRDQDELHQRLSERVTSRTFERQVNELHIRVLVLNRFTELGRPQTIVVASCVWGQGITQPQTDLCNNAPPCNKQHIALGTWSFFTLGNPAKAHGEGDTLAPAQQINIHDPAVQLAGLLALGADAVLNLCQSPLHQYLLRHAQIGTPENIDIRLC